MNGLRFIKGNWKSVNCWNSLSVNSRELCPPPVHYKFIICNEMVAAYLRAEITRLRSSLKLRKQRIMPGINGVLQKWNVIVSRLRSMQRAHVELISSTLATPGKMYFFRSGPDSQAENGVSVKSGFKQEAWYFFVALIYSYFLLKEILITVVYSCSPNSSIVL